RPASGRRWPARRGSAPSASGLTAEEVDQVIPAASGLLQQFALASLLSLDQFVRVVIANRCDVVAYQLGKDLGRKRVQLPRLVAVLSDVAVRPRVRQLGRVGRRRVLLDLVEVQGDAANLDRFSGAVGLVPDVLEDLGDLDRALAGAVVEPAAVLGQPVLGDEGLEAIADVA